MFKLIDSEQGWHLKLIMRKETRDRLAQTCFRGKDAVCAGNFLRWASIEEMLEDPEVLRLLVIELAKEIKGKPQEGTLGIEVVCRKFIGWASTAPRKNYEKSELEPFKPNRHTNAMRVKKGRDILVPLTKRVTIIMELKREGRDWAAVIHSVYPGKDVGKLTGNITEREGVVFFGWNHQGATVNSN